MILNILISLGLSTAFVFSGFAFYFDKLDYVLVAFVAMCVSLIFVGIKFKIMRG